MINEEIIDTMVRTAKDAMQKSHSPYSDRPVGACVLTSDGTLYGGCSVENAAFGLSCCAERVAIFKAVADSKREFDAIAIVADTEEPCVPCGACCPVMEELKIPDVIMANLTEAVEVEDLLVLAPRATGKARINGKD